MRKFKQILAGIAIIAISVAVFFAWKLFPIISGFGAKQMCSCVFLGKRSPASVRKNELASFPLSIGSYHVDMKDSSATGYVFGSAKRKAIYRRGLGCTLVVGSKEDEVRAQRIGPVRTSGVTDVFDLIDSAATDTTTMQANLDRVNETIENAFIEDTTQQKRRNMRAVVVVHRGRIIGEKYAGGFDKNSLHLGWSMTKSIVNNPTIALMIRDSILQLGSSALFGEWQDDRKKITVNDLLQMTPGLNWDESYSGESDATIMLYKVKGMGDYALHASLGNPPGSVFSYSSGTANILAELSRRKLGDEVYYSYLYKNIVDKIGAHSFVIEPDASGTFVSSSYSWATARDWAKIGLLYANDGVWNGERLLPEGWVSYTTTPFEGAAYGEYGAHFWLNAGSKSDPNNRFFSDVPPDMFYADGFQGQRIFIIPSKQLVVVKLCQTTGNYLDENTFLRDIINAL